MKRDVKTHRICNNRKEEIIFTLLMTLYDFGFSKEMINEILMTLDAQNWLQGLDKQNVVNV